MMTVPATEGFVACKTYSNFPHAFFFDGTMPLRMQATIFGG